MIFRDLRPLRFLPMMLVLTACGTEAGNIAQQTVTELADRSGSNWRTSTTRDPMTDAVLYVADGTFEAAPFTLQVKVTCRAGNLLTYQFSTFEGEEGAPLKTSVFTAGIAAFRSTSVDVRLDDKQAETWSAKVHDYSNAFSVTNEDNISTFSGKPINTDVALRGKPADYSLFASRMQVAATVRLRLALQTGAPTFEIDQTDSALRSVLSRCPPKTPLVPSSEAEESGDEISSETVGPQSDVEATPPVADEMPAKAKPEPAATSTEPIAGQPAQYSNGM